MLCCCQKDFVKTMGRKTGLSRTTKGLLLVLVFVTSCVAMDISEDVALSDDADAVRSDPRYGFKTYYNSDVINNANDVNDWYEGRQTPDADVTQESPDEEIPPGSSSLAFVFDITGSMNDDLVQVIDGAAKILATTLSRREKPLYNYVLVPFHDPRKCCLFICPYVRCSYNLDWIHVFC